MRARIASLPAAVLLVLGALVVGALAWVPTASAQDAPRGHARHAQSDGRAQSCPSVDGPKCHVRLRTGIRMAYVEVGPRRGKPVILLHGLTDSSRSWSLSMRALHRLRPNLHIYALDLRGQGASSQPKKRACRSHPERCYEMEDLAADVVAFMDTQRIRSASIAGHSMGSFVAQEIGLRYPRRADRLVLVASSTTGVNNPTLRDFVLPQVEGPWRDSLVAQGRSWPRDAYARTPLDADPNAVEWMKQSWDADPVAPQSLVSAIAAETARVPLGTWLGETKALLATDNTRRLRHLKIPTLVLWGAQDSIFYDTDQHRLVKALTRAARGKGSFAWKQYGARPLPASGFQESDIGHNVQWEAPAKVARDIASYLRTGRPTKDLYRTDHPDGTHHIVTEPGAARIISRR